jgi:hypothetical protein
VRACMGVAVERGLGGHVAMSYTLPQRPADINTQDGREGGDTTAGMEG